MQTSKKWYESKLVWVGIIQVLIAVCEFAGTLSPQAAAVASGINGVLVVALRTITSTSITK